MNRKLFKRIIVAFGVLGLTLTGCNKSGTVNNNDDPRYKIFQLAVEEGYTGTYQEWLSSIKGQDGKDGHSPVITIGDNGNWFIDDVDTGVKARGEDGVNGQNGEQGPKGDTGEPGKDGADGAPGKDGLNGQDGADGSSLLTGNGVPQNSLGKDGDSFIDLDTWNYYVRANGEWSISGNIKGAQGEQGPKGETGAAGQDGTNGIDGKNGVDGTSILNGNGTPTPNIGKDGDSYIDLDNWNYYMKINGSWIKLGNIKGAQGEKGETGATGQDGKSAYDLAVEKGYKGTLDEWLASLIGEKGETGAAGQNGKDGVDGKDGLNGQDGKDGADGQNGKSAYDLAVENGYTGTLTEWLESLIGEAGKQGEKGETGAAGQDGKDGINGIDGQDGKSAYELALEAGFKGSLEEWLLSLIGAKGETGAAGQNGKDGVDGKDGADGQDGKDGINGIDGQDGKSAYELAVENGFKGSLAEWLASLVGKDGKDGKDGVSVVKIEKTSSNGLIDTYTITYSNGTTSTFVVTNGKDGGKGDTGETGKSAYQIYCEAHPEYNKSEDEWMDDLVNGRLATIEKHTVTFDSKGGSQVSSQLVEDGKKAKKPSDPIKEGYTFVGWVDENNDHWVFNGYSITDDITLYAVWEINVYTVTFKNYDGTVLATDEVDYGGTAYYDGVIPTKPSTQQYSYTFSRWDSSLNNVTSNRVITALFDSILNQYTVTFKNYDGTILDYSTVYYGDSAFYAGPTPTRPSTAQYSYSFVGWDKTFSYVTDNTVITAVFEPTVNQYLVTFKDYDDTILGQSLVFYGESASFNGSTPNRPSDSLYRYYFSGWDVDFSNVTNDLVVTAQYYSEPLQCTVTFKNWDGTILQTSTVQVETLVKYEGETPTKPAISGSETTFVFNGWSVSGYQEYNDEGVYAWQDMTFIAQFAEAKDGLKYRREYNWEIISTDPWEEKETSTYTVLGYYEDVTNLAIPNEINGFPVTRVSQKALFECDSLTSLTLPDNMLYIESSAFSHCTNLSSIYLNDGLLSIGDSAFCMSAIYSIYIPLSVTTIGKSAFIQQSSKSSPAPTHYIEYYCAASERPSGWTYSPNGSNSYGNYWNAYNYRNVSGKTSYTYQTPESHIHWGSTR